MTIIFPNFELDIKSYNLNFSGFQWTILLHCHLAPIDRAIQHGIGSNLAWHLPTGPSGLPNQRLRSSGSIFVVDGVLLLRSYKSPPKTSFDEELYGISILDLMTLDLHHLMTLITIVPLTFVMNNIRQFNLFNDGRVGSTQIHIWDFISPLCRPTIFI